jgi:hypothetical protein
VVIRMQPASFTIDRAMEKLKTGFTQ